MFILVLPSQHTNNNMSIFFDDEINDSTMTITHENLLKLKTGISQTIDKPNLETFKVYSPYKDDGGQLNGKEWEKYMEKFTQQITYKLKQLIDKSYSSGVHWSSGSALEVETYFNSNPITRSLYVDVWHHYRELCDKKVCKIFGQSDALSKLKDLFRKSLKKQTPPIVLQSDDGLGKTTMLCETASLAKTWIGSTTNVMLRFVNLNATCKFAHEVLRSLCIQICMTYDFSSLFSTFKDCYMTEKITEWFDLVCLEASKISNTVTVILIDDVHLLKYASHGGGRVLSTVPWIPSLLPRNIVLMVTVNKNVSIDKLPLKKFDSVNIVQVQSYKDSELLDLTKSVVRNCNKIISSDQETSIKKVLKLCPSPLYSVILGAEASKWSSSHTFNGQGLPTTIGAYIEDKLQKIEKLYGYEICSNFCTYLECAHYGLTETELLDLLNESRELVLKSSNGQNVLKTGSFPFFIWSMIKEDFGNFMNPDLSSKYLFMVFNFYV